MARESRQFCTNCLRFGHEARECTRSGLIDGDERADLLRALRGRGDQGSQAGDGLSSAPVGSVEAHSPGDGRTRLSVTVEGDVGGLAEAIGRLALSALGDSPRAPRGATAAGKDPPRPASARAPRSDPKGAAPAAPKGRLPGENPPKGVLRCKGLRKNGERCQRWSSDSFPQSRPILLTGYCTQHASQRRSH